MDKDKTGMMDMSGREGGGGERGDHTSFLVESSHLILKLGHDACGTTR